MTHEATRLAEEGPLKQQTLPGALKNILRIDADLSKPRLVPYERMLIEHAIDALAALAQTAPTAEVALPAVSEADHPLHRCCDCPACTAYFADNPISNSDGAIYARAQSAVSEEADFEVCVQYDEDSMGVASTSGPRDRALAEAMNYARQYLEEGPVEVFEVVRTSIAKLEFRAQSAAKGDAP